MNGVTGEEIDALRARLPAALEWACAGGPRDQDHPHYQAVTERRDRGAMKARYSSCGDLAHWMLFHAGCRQPWINRDEHTEGDAGPRDGWDGGVNVSRLAFDAPCRKLGPHPGFETGDVLIVWNSPKGTDAHVIVVYSFDPTSQRLVTAEFGQPGGGVQDRTLIRRNGEWFIHSVALGPRRIQRWLPFAAVVTDAAERGELEPPTLPPEAA
jgi:hypothetical protein